MKSLQLLPQRVRNTLFSASNKKRFWHILAGLHLKWLYWHLKKQKGEVELALGYKKCKFFYNTCTNYQKKILQEKSINKRADLYKEFYLFFTQFFKNNFNERHVFGFNKDLINNNIDLFKNKVVLDYGCGYGNSTQLISQSSDYVYGIDASDLMIQTAKKKFGHLKNIEFITNTSPYIPIKYKKIDIAYSNDLIEHLHPEDAIIHFKEIFRIIKTGGKYLFWTPGSKNGPYDCTSWFYPKGVGFKSRAGHIKEYTFEEIISILRNVGFSNIYLPNLKREVLVIATK